MRPVARALVVVVLVAVAAIGGFLGGWYFHTPAATSSGPTSTTLGVIAAGSLSPILPSLASAFANVTPGVQAPVSAQLYEGSTAAATALTTETSPPYDLFVSADYRVIPQHLEPSTVKVASWEAIFAADPVVLAYSTSVNALSGINASNWDEKIASAGVTLGVANASSDPLGANAIFVLELEDALTHQDGALYGHFFNGAPGALATPTASTKVVAENVAAMALSSGEVSAYLIYRSYAVVDHLTYTTLNSSVNLGATDRADIAQYRDRPHDRALGQLDQDGGGGSGPLRPHRAVERPERRARDRVRRLPPLEQHLGDLGGRRVRADRPGVGRRTGERAGGPRGLRAARVARVAALPRGPA